MPSSKGWTETKFIQSILTLETDRSDGEVKAEIEALMDGKPIGKRQGMEKERRNDILSMVKERKG